MLIALGASGALGRMAAKSSISSNSLICRPSGQVQTSSSPIRIDAFLALIQAQENEDRERLESGLHCPDCVVNDDIHASDQAVRQPARAAWLIPVDFISDYETGLKRLAHGAPVGSRAPPFG